MIALVEDNQENLSALCRKYAVRRLDLFGSATSEAEFDFDRSDLDFLVEFDRTDRIGPADQYFGLLDELRKLFDREIHLVSIRSLRNPYFIDAVARTRQSVYAS
ncbi:MAG: nucleotidyltransferase domain-containing protein [Planctomycetaceae bacterium]